MTSNRTSLRRTAALKIDSTAWIAVKRREITVENSLNKKTSQEAIVRHGGDKDDESENYSQQAIASR